jgi:endonuclease/exonuclease/phosphatase family metal-dependent hydrolase
METVRIGTLNLWNRSGPWEHRLRLIRAEIGRLGLDVLGLQEVLRLTPAGTPADGCIQLGSAPQPGDQASEVGAGHFAAAVHGPAADLGGGLSFGNAVLSRWPVLDHRVYELPGRESGETRSLLYAVLEHPIGRLPVFVTHLNWKLHQGAVRVEQVLFITERMKELCPIGPVAGPDLPPVLLGDLNAEPESDEIRFLRGLATLRGRSVYFADAWVHGGDGSAGYTFHRENGFAARAHEPSRRIDYVFVRGPDRAFRGEPVKTAIAFHVPDRTGAGEGEVWPSDHFGVVTDLVVSKRSE